MRWFFAVMVCAGCSAALAADPRVGLRPAYGVPLHNRIESLAPPVVERGKTTRVVFTGHALGKALDAWTSLPSGAIRAVPVASEPDRIVMDITATNDSPVGVCGLRLSTEDGLTNACLLLVDDLPLRSSATALELPAYVWGTFREGTVDKYRFTVAAGERVSFEVVANRLGKDADPLVTIRDATGRLVAERDNDPGLGFDSRFEHRFDAAGSYTVEVRDARFKASEHHHYVLRAGRFPAGRVAVPAAIEAGFTPEFTLPEVAGSSFTTAMPRTQLGPHWINVKRPGDHGNAWVAMTPSQGPVTVADEWDEPRESGWSQAASGPASLAFLLSPGFRNPFLPLERHFTLGRWQATPAVVPGSLCGVLRKPGRTDAFKLHLQKGERIFIRGEARALGSPADLELAIIDRTGREQRRAGENARTREEANFDFTAPAAGDYALLVRDAVRDGGDAFAYRIAVRSTPFPPQLTAEVEGLTVPRGTWQPVPLTAVRNGFTGPIRLHLIGGTGLKLTPDEIGEKETSVVCRLEADGSAPHGVQTVQIVGKAGSDRVPVNMRPLIDMKWQNVDLIPLALREDQTRLPPSLADRFAVQVTPPAPFRFELPEAEVLLPRYQCAAIPVRTERIAGFEGPIAFSARGGQLAEKSEGRTRVYAEIPDATATKPNPTGEVVSKILSNVGKSRIEVTAASVHKGRRIELTRTFDLDLTTAFKFGTEPAKLSLLPGELGKVRIAVSRVKSFDGPLVLHLQPTQGLSFPETVMLAKGQSHLEIEVTATADAQPRKQGLSVLATGEVDGFEEEVRGTPVEIEIRAKPKK
jgi:hypothetical protein